MLFLWKILIFGVFCVYCHASIGHSNAFIRNGQTYFYSIHSVTEKVTWLQAQQKCLRFSGNLASVANEKEYLILRDVIHSFQVSDVEETFWIGLHDTVEELKFKWSDGTKFFYGTQGGKPVTGRRPWGAGMPETSFDNQLDCVLMGKWMYAEWFTVICDQTASYICIRKGASDPRYIRSKFAPRNDTAEQELTASQKRLEKLEKLQLQLSSDVDKKIALIVTVTCVSAIALLIAVCFMCIALVRNRRLLRKSLVSRRRYHQPPHNGFTGTLSVDGETETYNVEAQSHEQPAAASDATYCTAPMAEEGVYDEMQDMRKRPLPVPAPSQGHPLPNGHHNKCYANKK